MKIIQGKVERPYRVMLYGVAGIGKSTWAADAENPIVIQTEDGNDQIGVDRFPVAKTFEEIVEAGKQLIAEDHEYKTVVIDSMDWLEKIIHEELCTEYGAKSIMDEDCKSFGYGKGFGLALPYFARVLKMCEILNSKKNMNVILLAHSEVKRHEDPRVEGYDRYQPKMHKSASSLITEWAEGVFFAGKEVVTRQVEGTFNKKVTKGQDTGTRILYTEESPAYIAKNRWALPPMLPLNHAAFIAAKGKQI